MFSRNNRQVILINKNLKNNIYKHLYNINKNHHVFHPHFHLNIQNKFLSNLQIQCPVQMKVRKLIINKLERHKLITFYPQKIQIEIRPFYKFEQNPKNQNFFQSYRIPLFNNYYNDRNELLNQISHQAYININNNYEYSNKRVIHNRVKRKRPMFKIPPCKKVAVSQGKSLNFIHKYYDENFILEEDDEEEKILNSERKQRIMNRKKNESNFISDSEENIIKKEKDILGEKANKYQCKKC